MSVAIVIVNYRTPDLVIDCLKSLADEGGGDEGGGGEGGGALALRIFVGDAASGDGSTARIAAFIREAGMENALCYDIGRNGGFAYGNNHIVETHVLGDPGIAYVHFLNPDTVIHPGAVRRLAGFLRSHPDAGAAGSRLENPDGTLQSSAFRFPAPWREFFRGARIAALDRLAPGSPVHIANLRETCEVDWVSGASFMAPRAVLERAGLMDPGYFLYFEEVDLMARIRRAGHAIWHVVESRVVHLEGQATGVRSGSAPRRLPAYWFHSRFKFFHDRHGRVGAVMANLMFMAGDLIYRLHRAVRRRPNEDPPHLWRDLWTHGFSLPPGPERGE